LRDGKALLPARLKILLYVLLVIGLFFIRDVHVHMLIGGAVLVISLVGLSVKRMKGGFVPIFILLFFTFAGNLFFHPGRIIFSKGFLTITDEGTHLASLRTIRVFSMIFGAKLLTATVSIEELLRSLETILYPLEKVGIPIREFFSVMGLTLQCFPTLMTHLLKSYRKGADGSVHGFRKRVGYMAAFLLPVFAESIRSPEVFFTPTEGTNTPEDKK